MISELEQLPEMLHRVIHDACLKLLCVRGFVGIARSTQLVKSIWGQVACCV